MNDVLELTRLGLTEGEAKVYLALSQLGTSTVGPIAYRSGVAYSNIYEVLHRLIEKGIVSHITKGKTRHYQAASARNILRYLEQRQEEVAAQREALERMLPRLEALQRMVPQAEAEVFIGRKGLRSAYEKLLSSGKLSFFYLHDPAYAKEADLFYMSIMDLLERGGHRGLGDTRYRKSPFFKASKRLIDTRFVDFPIPGNVEACGERMLLVSWSEQVTGILIRSQEIADNFFAYFEEAWKRGKP